jgi:hypothetical protein
MPSRRRRLSRHQRRAGPSCRAIAACRAPALGGQQFACDACGSTQWRWHSCRTRNCTRCQKQAADARCSARIAELLDVPYAHLLFTLPHELNALARHHPRSTCETLLECTAATLSVFAANTAFRTQTARISFARSMPTVVRLSTTSPPGSDRCNKNFNRGTSMPCDFASLQDGKSLLFIEHGQARSPLCRSRTCQITCLR